MRVDTRGSLSLDMAGNACEAPVQGWCCLLTQGSRCRADIGPQLVETRHTCMLSTRVAKSSFLASQSIWEPYLIDRREGPSFQASARTEWCPK